jgi:hypothetical protein
MVDHLWVATLRLEGFPIGASLLLDEKGQQHPRRRDKAMHQLRPRKESWRSKKYLTLKTMTTAVSEEEPEENENHLYLLVFLFSLNF